MSWLKSVGLWAVYQCKGANPTATLYGRWVTIIEIFRFASWLGRSSIRSLCFTSITTPSCRSTCGLDFGSYLAATGPSLPWSTPLSTLSCTPTTYLPDSVLASRSIYGKGKFILLNKIVAALGLLISSLLWPTPWKIQASEYRSANHNHLRVSMLQCLWL